MAVVSWLSNDNEVTKKKIRDDNIATIELNASSASKTYTVGKRFVLDSDGKLYKATQQIDQGSAIITSGANVNCVEDTEKILDNLGTASTKNSTSVVTESTDLVESGAVKDAIVNTVGWIGGNLLSYPYYEQTATYAWGTVTVNGDGSITVNGTTTERTAIKLETPAMNYDLPNGNYILSLENVQSGAALLLEGYNGITWAKLIGSANASYPSVSVSIDHNGYTNLSVYISIESDTTLNNVTFKPMISKRGGSFVSPHSSVEQTLRDAELVQGKNLLPLTLDSIKALNTGANNWSWNGNIGTSNGIDFTISTDSNGYVTQIDVNRVSGTGDSYLFLTRNLDNILTNGVQYIMNGCNSGTNGVKIYTGNGGQWDCYNGDALATYTSNWKNLCIKVGIGESPNHVKMYPMIRKASETDPTYEPYYIPLKDVVPNKCDNSVIAPVENGATSSKDYAVGEHFIRDGAFCTCKQPISQGGSFTLGTNYTAGDVAELLTRSSTFSLSDVFSAYAKVSDVRLAKYGNVVQIRLHTTSGSIEPNVWDVIGTLKDEYKPLITCYETALNTSGEPVGWVRIKESGDIDIYHTGSANISCVLGATYITAK